MTVLPFSTRESRRRGSLGSSGTLSAPVTGTFRSPSGRQGRFTGTYRLERLRTEYDQLVAAGVVTGELLDADDTPVALGSRRHVSAVTLMTGIERHVLVVGPVDVNVAGFLVSLDEFSVAVPRTLPTEV